MALAAAGTRAMSLSGDLPRQSAHQRSSTLAALVAAPEAPVSSPIPSKPPEELTVPTLQFLGSQDGPTEKLLESRLIRLFVSRADVSRAYLVRVSYGSVRGHSVALALRGDRMRAKEIVQAVGGVFTEMFNAKEHLDIIFVDDNEEARLAAVCTPFYDRGRTPPAD